MMKRLLRAFAVVSLGVTVCRCGSICDDAYDASKELADKVKACPSFSEVNYIPPTEEEKNECEDSVKGCTITEKDLLNTFIDCLKDLPECTPSEEQRFSSAFQACAELMSGVSETCGLDPATESAVRKGMVLIRSR